MPVICDIHRHHSDLHWQVEMKNPEDELFVRFILFKKDWDEASSYFEASKKATDKLIRDGLIKIGIVTYAKPFMGNTGIHAEVRKFRLEKSFIPEEYIWLHEMMMNYRGNFIGHSNFKTIVPEMGKLEDTPKGKMRPIKYMAISYDHWFKFDDEFPDEALLIDDAIALSRKLSEELGSPTFSNEDLLNEE